MVFNTAVLKSLRFGGRLATTESWECGVHLGCATNTGTASQYETAISNWVQSSQSYVNGIAKLDYIKFNAIDIQTGKYVDQTFSDTYFLPTPASGGRQTGPVQISIAVSLRTAQLRGRGHEGRFYPPTGGVDVGADGTIAVSVQAGVLQSGVELIQAINAVDSSRRVCIFSPVAHVLREVTGVRVGRVPDTQRRRRKGLPESYVLAPVVP